MLLNKIYSFSFLSFYGEESYLRLAYIHDLS